MKARLMILSAFAALPMLASAAAFTPAELDKAVASLPKANVMGGFAVHSKQFCGSCHGMTGKGRSNGKVPVLHGQNPTYLAAQLRDYRDGRRDNDVLKEMRFFAQKLTDDEINALADFYAGETGWPGVKPAKPAAKAAAK